MQIKEDFLRETFIEVLQRLREKVFGNRRPPRFVTHFALVLLAGLPFLLYAALKPPVADEDPAAVREAAQGVASSPSPSPPAPFFVFPGPAETAPPPLPAPAPTPEPPLPSPTPAPSISPAPAASQAPPPPAQAQSTPSTPPPAPPAPAPQPPLPSAPPHCDAVADPAGYDACITR